MNQQYRIVSNIISQNKFAFFIFFLISVIQSGMALLVPYLSKFQIDQLESQHRNFFGVFHSGPVVIFTFIIIITVAVNLLNKIFSTASNIFKEKIDYGCSIKLEKEIYDRIERFDAGFMQNPRNRRIVNGSIFLSPEY